ncbi:hypothetical protein N0V93_002430 [Gnomoniopsis smithogilvyi]|uniref:Amino acid permease/ SLC12A domain-containing protein n=1 Tax=Gnomoniopsis smithogilvyi TaxID=1191159 RepID=A0A9W9CYZ6_9PEZI|nr:hypothetical protein N0V93_002430 [Gnomoniopsis smithogilvyi]
MVGTTANAPPDRLRQELRSYQILAIVLSGIIGTGVSVTNIDALKLVGPAGLLVALAVLGIVAVSVGETVSHLVQLFPTPNAIFEYVYNFVDEELAWIIGFMYWYIWVAVFTTELLTAATIAQYWRSDIIGSIAFYILAPMVFIIINFAGVKYFGWIETIGGMLKFLLMIGMTVALWVTAGENNDGQAGPITEGFQTNADYADTFGTSFCMALSLVAWSFGGIESTTMAAYEAKYQKDVSFASTKLHWIVFGIYLIYSLALALTVPWNFVPTLSIYTRAATNEALCGDTTIAVVIALCDQSGKHPEGQPVLAGFVNGCLLYAVLSCANTSLYIASRTLHGLASSKRLEGRGPVSRFIRLFGSTYRWTGVPFSAVCASCAVLCWVPMLGFHQSYADDDDPLLGGFKVFLFFTSSTAYVIVWAVLCVAFIRFRSWTNWCAPGLKRLDEPLDVEHAAISSGDALSVLPRRNNYSKYITEDPRSTYSEHIKYLLGQPWAALLRGRYDFDALDHAQTQEMGTWAESMVETRY